MKTTNLNTTHIVSIASVNIRPDVGILSVLRHLNYDAWYALAEFVDNSLESFLGHRGEILAVDGPGTRLHVEIEVDSSEDGFIAIRDNAAGIHEYEYQRAFRPAEPPPTATGLSEFGMGMKSAACWFGDHFVVRSSALGEPVERTVEFDVNEIVSSKFESLPVNTRSAPAEQHFTEVVISVLHKPPRGKTTAKIKDHLASIYREYLRDGTFELRFRSPGIDEYLVYEEPETLFAPPADSLIRRRGLSRDARVWRKNIEFDFGVGLKAHGFAALRRKGSTSQAGFALFRRKRLIEGSGEDSYRPHQIFGASTTAVYQRLFGELHLEGFSVSHTKDGFQWDETEDTFLALLKAELNADPLPLIDQARYANYDSFSDSGDDQAKISAAVEEAIHDTVDVIREHAVPVIRDQVVSVVEPVINLPVTLPLVERSWKESLRVELEDTTWDIDVEVSNDPAIGDWVSVSVADSDANDGGNSSDSDRHLSVRLSLAHPFMTRFVGSDLDRVKPFVRIAAAIGLSEITARDAGVKQAGELRRNINELLRDVFSKS